MRRALRWAGFGLLGLVGLLLAVAGYVRFRLPSVPPPVIASITATPDRLARGAYLSEHVAVCLDCHSERDFSKFAGPISPGSLGKGGEKFGHEFGFPGDLVAPNITPFALRSWSDAELVSALTQGVTPDGRALFPFMNYPAYGKLCRADLEAIVSYVRSLPSIESQPPRTVLDFPVSLIVRTLPTARPIVETCPDPTDTVATGRYLVETASCRDCHSQHDGPGLKVGFEFAGGVDFPLPGGFKARSKNITPDQATGIGSWTREAFIKRFADYRDPSSQYAVAKGEPNTIMPWPRYAGMTDSDLGAIYDYLRTLEPVNTASSELAKR